MSQSTVIIDPDSYIKQLSHIKSSIISSLPSDIKSQPNLQSQLDKQMLTNFIKYKKQTLLKQRLLLSQQQQKQQQLKRKHFLLKSIEHKIQKGQQIRKEKRKIQNQRIIKERIIKEGMIRQNKQIIRAQKVRKTIQVIQNLQRKQKIINQVDVLDRLRYKIGSKQSLSQKPTQPLQTSPKRSLSQVHLPRLPQHLPSRQSTSSALSHHSSSQNSQSISCLIQKMRQPNKSKSNKSIKKQVNDYDMLQKIIEEKRLDGLQKWAQRNSVSYKAKHLSRHQEIKHVIQNYLRNHIVRIN